MVSAELKEELKALSFEIFGSTSRWQKLVDKGEPTLVMEEIDEFVPPEDEAGEGFTRKVKRPVLLNGVHQFYTKHYTPESARDYLLELKRQNEEWKKAVAAINEERKLKEEQEKLNKSVQQQAGGSLK